MATALFSLVASLLASTAAACTTIAAGAKATEHGSVMIGHSDDGDPIADPRLIFVPAADHPPGSKRYIYNTNLEYPRSVSYHRGLDYRPDEFTDAVLGKSGVRETIGSIPEVAHTFAYQDTDYGAINEQNVAIAESTCSAMFRTCQVNTSIGCEPGRTKGEALLDVGSLSEIAMERASTARQAVQLMGELAYKYGFFGSQDANGYGEALQVADPTEVWTFHILADDTGTKAIWAAVRVPDDQVTVLANMFTIRKVDVNDTKNCMASPNVYTVAAKYGWWNSGEVLDFTRVYSNGEYGYKYYSGRRMWRVLSLASPSLNLNPNYTDLKYDRSWPWSVKPDKLITLQDVFSWYRDYYAGTQFDMTKGLAAGYGGTPDRFSTVASPVKGSWERTIALYRSNFVFVQELILPTKARPREASGVLWFAAGPAHYSPFLPVPSGLAQSLTPLKTFYPWRSLQGSMNWACRKVMTIAQARFDFMHQLVVKKQQKLEDVASSMLSEAARRFAESGDSQAFQQVFVEHASSALLEWHSLADEMLFSYSDNRRFGDASAPSMPGALGYPEAWLQAVGYSQGPPPVPPIRAGACPNWDENCYSGLSLLVDSAWYWLFMCCAACILTMLACFLGRTRSAKGSQAQDTGLYSRF